MMHLCITQCTYTGRPCTAKRAVLSVHYLSHFGNKLTIHLVDVASASTGLLLLSSPSSMRLIPYVLPIRLPLISLSLPPSLYPSISPPCPSFFPLPPSIPLSVSFFLSLCLSLYPCLCRFLSLPLSLSLYVCLRLCLSICLCMSLSVALCLSVCLSVVKSRSYTFFPSLRLMDTTACIVSPKASFVAPCCHLASLPPLTPQDSLIYII